MPKADPFAQLRLLEMADIDRALGAVAHRRANLPELAAIAQARSRLDELAGEQVLIDTEIGDLDRDARKLDAEIDQVRTRADRDRRLLAAGTAPAKDLESLQSEIESLQRRQSNLEDDALELMERRETADGRQSELRSARQEVSTGLATAERRRDDTLAELDGQQQQLQEQRSGIASGLPAELLALYERIHASGRVAAGALRGRRCEACRIDLDTVEVNAIRAAAPDEVVRCDECGAILVRS